MATIYRDTTNKYQTSTIGIEETAKAKDFIEVLSSTVTSIFGQMNTVGKKIGGIFDSVFPSSGSSTAGNQNNHNQTANNPNYTTMIIVIVAVLAVIFLLFKRRRK